MTKKKIDSVPRRPGREEVEAAIDVLLRWVGEDPSREGLQETPARVAKSFEELFGGYQLDVRDYLDRTFDEVAGYNEIVVLKDIGFFSHCEHHMVPIIGKAHVGYLPQDRVLGLSKMARVVDVYARRLQTQESMTAQIADAIQIYLKPRGVCVAIEAQHLCMAMRGIRQLGTTTWTMKSTGEMRTNQQEQARFMAMIGAHSQAAG